MKREAFMAALVFMFSAGAAFKHTTTRMTEPIWPFPEPANAWTTSTTPTSTTVTSTRSSTTETKVANVTSKDVISKDAATRKVITAKKIAEHNRWGDNRSLFAQLGDLFYYSFEYLGTGLYNTFVKPWVEAQVEVDGEIERDLNKREELWAKKNNISSKDLTEIKKMYVNETRECWGSC